MTVPTDPRIRPPRDKESLIQRLLTTAEGPFEHRYQVMVFAASLGWANNRPEPLEAGGEGIRYETFRKHGTMEAFIDSLGVLSVAEQRDNELIVDASIMGADQLQKRIGIFEEYANGGLAIIQAYLNRGVRPMDVILDLCREGSTRNTDPLGFVLQPLSAPNIS